MIQDIAPHRFSNEYRPKPPGKESVLLCYRDKEVLVRKEDGMLQFPTFAELDAEGRDVREGAVYLFEIDGICFYLAGELPGEMPLDFRMEPVEQFRHAKPMHLAFAGITGFQLYNWYRSRRFCGRCGHKMKPDAKERMMYCPECGMMEYPKICPAVIVGLTDGNRLLMSQYADREYKKYALLAGFAEIGETIEETVRREVMEEVGLKVKNLTYYKSQPWSFSDTLLFGFFAELDGADEITLDREELAFAEWFEREDIPVYEKNISLTNEMILAFKNGLV